MSGRYSPEAVAKGIETRKALGPRLPKSPRAPHKVTAPPKTPRATGAARDAIK
jgi:hypothetical protein